MEAEEYRARLTQIIDGDGKTQHQRNLARINWLCNELVLASGCKATIEASARIQIVAYTE